MVWRSRWCLVLSIMLVSLGGCGETGIAVNADGSLIDVVVDDVTVTVDSALQPDVVTADLQPEDVADAAEECVAGSGCFGEPCSGPDDCLSGICTPHQGEKVCSKTCDTACPDGFTCTLVGTGADGSYVCISNFVHLCQPCASNADCVSAEGQDACVVYEGEGAFCGGVCDEDTPCPEGYSCKMVSSVGGGSSNQCVSDAGVCACSTRSIALALATPCAVTNDHGTCEGLRICEEPTLSACDAPEATEETCNGIDDNCDGDVDEGTCDDGNPCTEDSCAGADGCVHVGLDGVACDDADPCTTAEVCTQGSCVGELTQCQDGNPCTDDLCDEVLGCTFPANTAPCDDGSDCTVDDVCAETTCGGQPKDCDDDNDCTEDYCVPGDGCVTVPLDAVTCDDGLSCSTGDACVEGVCEADKTDCVCEVDPEMDVTKVTQLSLAWQDKLSFVLDDKLTIKRLRFEDVLQEQAEQDGGDDALAQQDASFVLMMMTLVEFLPELFTALGGEEIPQGI